MITFICFRRVTHSYLNQNLKPEIQFRSYHAAFVGKNQFVSAWYIPGNPGSLPESEKVLRLLHEAGIPVPTDPDWNDHDEWGRALPPSLPVPITFDEEIPKHELSIFEFEALFSAEP